MHIAPLVLCLDVIFDSVIVHDGFDSLRYFSFNVKEIDLEKSHLGEDSFFFSCVQSSHPSETKKT